LHKIDAKTRAVLCIAQTKGKRHDFQLFKTSKTHISPSIKVKTDSGYQGIQRIHSNTILPIKSSKHKPLSKVQRQHNRTLSRERMLNEHVIGALKRFKIIAERYRNRRKRFNLRFTLSCAIYNMQLHPDINQF
jgi:DDE superfamily endonuclease